MRPRGELRDVELWFKAGQIIPPSIVTVFGIVSGISAFSWRLFYRIGALQTAPLAWVYHCAYSRP